MDRTFALISLGCPKNLINSEQMLYLLYESGFQMIDDISQADFVIINTCGFIDEAKSEAIDTILEACALNNNIIVTGCLPERYKGEIAAEFPEVKSFLGVCDYDKIIEAVDAVLSGKDYSSFSTDSSSIDELPRVVSTGPGWAYLRIAEGCNNFCAFCAIPFIRGRYRSRNFESIIEEAEDLASHGIKEIILVAQDITRYGIDKYGKYRLADLIRSISEIEGIEWIRLHYLYPEVITDDLIQEIAANEKVVKYLDIPIQHINSSILKHMNRHTSGDQIRSLFKKLKDNIPGLVIRTSLISGLPGEGEDEFEELCDFLREAKLQRAGVFPFSPEEGTPAAGMDHCDYETAQHRAEYIMTEIQSPIMDDFCSSFVGKTIRVLIQFFDEESGCFVGRSYADSPEIDGEVCCSGDCVPGEFSDVLITGFDDGILFGKAL